MVITFERDGIYVSCGSDEFIISDYKWKWEVIRTSLLNSDDFIGEFDSMYLALVEVYKICDKKGRMQFKG